MPENETVEARCNELAEILEEFLTSDLPQKTKAEKIQVAEQKVINAYSRAIAARTGEHVNHWV